MKIFVLRYNQFTPVFERRTRFFEDYDEALMVKAQVEEVGATEVCLDTFVGSLRHLLDEAHLMGWTDRGASERYAEKMHK